ncbi:MAG: hypothetical protein AAFP19_02050 [Bacteroidota bacterium]
MKTIRLFLSISLLSSLFFACQNEAKVTEQATAPAAEAQKPAAVIGDISAMADSACACYKVLYELRNDVRKDFQAGDSTAYQRSDLDLIEERQKAKVCARAIIDPLRDQASQLKAFQDALIKSCPDWATSVLIMNKVNWKPLEQ